MQSSTPHVNDSRRGRYWREIVRGVIVALGLLAVTTVLAVAQDPPPGAILRPWEPPDAVSIPDKNDQMRMQQQQQLQKQISYTAANLERKSKSSQTPLSFWNWRMN